jgi:uncharacterized protein (DUF1778 family)
MSETLTLRPEVLAFAQEMERRLRRGDKKYHGQTWEQWDCPYVASQHLERVHYRLDDAIGAWNLHTGHTEAQSRIEVVKRAADVANYAMMVFVLCGAYDAPKSPTMQDVEQSAKDMLTSEQGPVIGLNQIKGDDPCADTVIEGVVQDLRSRSRLGVKKYGVTLGNSKLTHEQLLRHAYEEALDLSNYLHGALAVLGSAETSPGLLRVNEDQYNELVAMLDKTTEVSEELRREVANRRWR